MSYGRESRDMIGFKFSAVFPVAVGSWVESLEREGTGRRVGWEDDPSELWWSCWDMDGWLMHACWLLHLRRCVRERATPRARNYSCCCYGLFQQLSQKTRGAGRKKRRASAGNWTWTARMARKKTRVSFCSWWSLARGTRFLWSSADRFSFPRRFKANLNTQIPSGLKRIGEKISLFLPQSFSIPKRVWGSQSSLIGQVLTVFFSWENGMLIFFF
jgi:hypothetical protein